MAAHLSWAAVELPAGGVNGNWQADERASVNLNSIMSTMADRAASAFSEHPSHNVSIQLASLLQPLVKEKVLSLDSSAGFRTCCGLLIDGGTQPYSTGEVQADHPIGRRSPYRRTTGWH